MADQCIVCLETLDFQADPPPLGAESAGSGFAPAPLPPERDRPASPISSTAAAGPVVTAPGDHIDNHDSIAVIDVCGHTLHDTCLREWTGKANSCPICRQSFHLVHVYDKVGGTLLSSYKVEDRKQVAEFDPQEWLDEGVEEEEAIPCPVCGEADQEDVLLLCDGCDAPYHTHCIGLDRVPDGSWFCMECADLVDPDVQVPIPRVSAARRRAGAAPGPASRNDFFPRTRATMRRVRRRARPDAWQGAWGQIAGRVFDLIDLDLDDDGNDALEEYRRSQQLRESERREFQRWQQRINIARRLGAQDIFAQSLPNALVQHVNDQRRSDPTPPRENREERRAWGAMERAMEVDATNPPSRKRKSRSTTGSPVEPQPEPARRLKRPRTRRIGAQNEPASSSRSPVSVQGRVERATNGSAAFGRSPLGANEEAPSFLSSLLKEVEMSTPSDDENIRCLFAENRPPADPSSPGSSPAASAGSSPRAMSTTPPPHRALRPSSPTLLSSHIEPVYPPANYSPTRSAGDASDGEQRRSPNGTAVAELRQPRPRRQQPISLPRSEDASPTRTPLSLEMKENISKVVRTALKPHWKSSQLTADQYAAINRDVSRKLYDEVSDPAAIDDDAKQLWEKKATKEVARALAELKA